MLDKTRGIKVEKCSVIEDHGGACKRDGSRLTDVSQHQGALH